MFHFNSQNQMKKFILSLYKIALAVYVSFLMTGCSEEFLDITPKGSIIASTTSDYELLFYNNNIIYGGSDLIVKMSPEAFMWEADIYQPIVVPDEISNFMSKIYVYNKIITEVMQSSEGSEYEKSALLAEAKASRAWCYFNLINFYGKPYNSQTAASDLGFPIITEADVTEDDFMRATVQQVYDFIIDDLETAIPVMNNSEDRLRLGKGGAEALLAKVYVFMGEYENALIMFNDAFNSFDMSSLEIDLYDLNLTTLPGGVNEPGFFGPNSPPAIDNIEIVYYKNLVNLNSILSSDVLLSSEAAALYGSNDLRFTKFYTNEEFFGPPFSVPNVYRRLGPASINTGIDIKDMYLLRIECKARTGDVGGAIADLETYRESRMPEADAVVPNLGQDDLIRFIIDERTREYAVQGMEWFTVRRLFNDPLFSNNNYVHVLYNNDASVNTIYTLTEDRLQLRFTEKILQENPGLINNP